MRTKIFFPPNKDCKNLLLRTVRSNRVKGGKFYICKIKRNDESGRKQNTPVKLAYVESTMERD